MFKLNPLEIVQAVKSIRKSRNESAHKYIESVAIEADELANIWHEIVTSIINGNNIDEGIQVKDDNINAMQQTDNNTFNLKLKEELDRLDEKQKSTFIMRYFDDMPIKEIAEALDCSEGTIKSRLFYTLKKLAVSLKDFSPQFVQILLALFILNK